MSCYFSPGLGVGRWRLREAALPRPRFGPRGRPWGGRHPARKAEADSSALLFVSGILSPALEFSEALIYCTFPDSPLPAFLRRAGHPFKCLRVRNLDLASPLSRRSGSRPEPDSERARCLPPPFQGLM